MLLKCLSFVVSALISTPTLAALDVNCWDGDCLKNGWTAKDMSNGAYTDYGCYRDGCLKDGWIAGGTQNIRYYTQCKEGGCFTTGWYEVDRDTQMMRMKTVCGEKSGVKDCLKFGWTTYLTGESYNTYCTNEDCRNQGWTSPRPSGNSVSAYCKAGGCFTVGWIWSN